MVIDKGYITSFDTYPNNQIRENPDKLLFNCENKTITLECNGGNCISIDYFNDMMPDCPSNNNRIPADEEFYYYLQFNTIKQNLVKTVYYSIVTLDILGG